FYSEVNDCGSLRPSAGTRPLWVDICLEALDFAEANRVNSKLRQIAGAWGTVFANGAGNGDRAGDGVQEGSKTTKGSTCADVVPLSWLYVARQKLGYSL